MNIQKTLDSFTSLKGISVATVTGTSTVLGYLFNDRGDSEDVTLTVTDTATDLRSLYRTFKADTTAQLPHAGLVLKPTEDLVISRPNVSVTVEPGVWRLGKNSTGYRGTFYDREVVETEYGLLPNLNLYYFISDTSAGTINGFFVNNFGTRTGSAFTAATSTTLASSFSDFYGQDLPTDAVGAVIDVDQDMVFDVTRDPAATAKTNLATNKANHPTISSGSSITYGKVV